MDSQQTQFSSALQGLTPEERNRYVKANPTVGIGGQTYVFGDSAQMGRLPDIPVDTSLSADEIGGTKAINITQPALSTGVDSLLGSIEAGTVQNATQFQQNQEKQRADAELKAKERASKKSGEEYVNTLLGTKGETQLTDEALRATGVDTAEAELKQINNDILAEQNALRRQIQEIEKNKGGMFGGGVQDEINRVKNISLAKQADLSIIQMAKQGRFDSAKEIADRRVAVQMEQNRNRLEAARFNYEENKEAFTKAEQRDFEAKVRAEERKLDKEETAAKTLSDTKLSVLKSASEQSAPASVLRAIQSARTPEEAIAAAGKYGGDILDRESRMLDMEYKRKQMSLLGEPTAAEKKASAAALKEAKSSIPVMRDKIAAVDVLKDHSGLNSRVGTGILSRTPQGVAGTFGKAATGVGLLALPFDAYDKITGSGQDFAGGVHKLVGGLTLQSLIDAKARGATFGALSEGELNILANSASAINDWEIKDSKGNGTGVWNIDQASFKRELDKIKELTNRAILLSEGTLIDDSEGAILDNVFSPQNTDRDPSAYY